MEDNKGLAFILNITIRDRERWTALAFLSVATVVLGFVPQPTGSKPFQKFCQSIRIDREITKTHITGLKFTVGAVIFN